MSVGFLGVYFLPKIIQQNPLLKKVTELSFVIILFSSALAVSRIFGDSKRRMMFSFPSGEFFLDGLGSWWNPMEMTTDNYWIAHIYIEKLVGGWINHFEKYALQYGSWNPKDPGEIWKLSKPPLRIDLKLRYAQIHPFSLMQYRKRAAKERWGTSWPLKDYGQFNPTDYTWDWYSDLLVIH